LLILKGNSPKIFSVNFNIYRSLSTNSRDQIGRRVIGEAISGYRHRRESMNAI